MGFKIKDIRAFSLGGRQNFLRLITEEVPFFLLRLAYHGDELISAILDGKELIDEKK